VESIYSQMRCDASNLITVPITPYNGTAVYNVKSNEISDVVKDTDLDAPVITEI